MGIIDRLPEIGIIEHINDQDTPGDTVYDTDDCRICHPITLGSNANRIRVSAVSTDGTQIARSDVRNITGDFPNPIRRVQLSCDAIQADLDLHLVIDGYRPKHITLEPTAPAGAYQLVVKYSNAHGQTGRDMETLVRIFYENNSLIVSPTHMPSFDGESSDDRICVRKRGGGRTG